MAVMQTAPSKYSQAFMTVIGLILLVMALVLNHKHPHNEGIANLPRNSIYKMNLAVSQKTNEVAQFDFAPGSVRQRQDNSALTPPTSPSNQQMAAVITAAATTSSVNVSQDQCQNTNEQAHKDALKAYESAYKGYLRASRAHKQEKSNSDSQQDYYQIYLNELDKAYSDYRLAVEAQGCTPVQSQPVPIEK